MLCKECKESFTFGAAWPDYEGRECGESAGFLVPIVRGAYPMFPAAKVPTRDGERRKAQPPGLRLLRSAHGLTANSNFVDGYCYKVNRDR
jgi:hypothetical protein